MYKWEIDPTLCRIMTIYRRLGIWRNDGKSVYRKSCMQILYFLQHISFVIYIFTCAYNAYLAGDNTQVIYLLGLQISVSFALVKLCYLLWQKEKILKFLDDPIMSHHSDDYRESVMVNQKIRKIAIFNKAYTLILSTTVLLVTLLPLPIFMRSKQMLPLFINFDSKSDYEMVFYWMTFAYGSFNSFFCAINMFLMLFIWYMMCNYAIEYKLLGKRFRSLGTQKTYRQEFIDLVRAHIYLFDTVEKFRSCFAAVFLIVITTGATFICVSLYNLAFNRSDNVFKLAFCVVFLVYAFFEVLVTMYLANEITLESNQISYCLFESNWMDQSESTKKSVIIFGEAIKSPQKLIVFLYPMDLDKFTSVVSGAYRMFNILKSFK